MAETVSLVAAIVQLADFSYRVAESLDDLRGQLGEVPKLFRPIKAEVDVVNKIITEMGRAGIDLSNISREAHVLVSSFKESLEELETLINRVQITGNESLPSQLRRAVSSVRNDHKMRAVIENLRGHTQTLHLIITQYHSKHYSTHQPRYAHCGTAPIAVSHFVGRKDTIARIQHHLTTHKHSQPRVVIRGIGGQGKTQLAFKIADDLYNTGQAHSVIWADASSKASASKSFETICNRIHQNIPLPDNPERKIEITKDTMAAWTKPWLLVLDNYDNPGGFPDLFGFVSLNANALVLITTRNAHVARQATLFEDIPGLDANSAVDLLIKRSGSEDIDVNRQDALQIVVKLAFLPLAIDQAGAFCLWKRFRLSQFLGKYEQEKEAMFRYTPDGWEYRKITTGGIQDSAVSVFTTWEMSLSQLGQGDDYRLQARDFLATCAFLDYGHVSELILRHKIREEIAQLYGGCEWQQLFFNSDGSWDTNRFENFLRDLSSLALVSQGRDSSTTLYFSMHPLVAEWLTSTCYKSIEKRRDAVFRSVHLVSATLGHVTPMHNDYPFDFTSFEQKQEILCHMKESERTLVALRIDSLVIGKDSLEHVGFLFSIFYGVACMYEKARALCETVLASQRSRLPQSHDTVRATSAWLAKIVSSQGNYQLAADIHSKLYEYRRNKYGTSDPRTIRAGLDAAKDLNLLGVDSLLDSTVLNTLSSEKDDALSWLLMRENRVICNDVIVHLSLMGDDDIARSICLKSLESPLEKVYPDVLFNRNYGYLLLKLGDIKDSIVMLREAVAFFELWFGRTHSQTVIAWFMLAESLRETRIPRNLEEAEKILARIIGSGIENLDLKNVETLPFMTHLAVTISLQGRNDEALEVLEPALTYFRGQCVSTNHRVRYAAYIFSKTLRASGRFHEAEQWDRRNVQESNAACGESSTETLYRRQELVLCLLESSASASPCICSIARHQEAYYILRDMVVHLRRETNFRAESYGTRKIGDRGKQTVLIEALMSSSRFMRIHGLHKESLLLMAEAFKCCFNRYGCDDEMIISVAEALINRNHEEPEGYRAIFSLADEANILEAVVADRERRRGLHDVITMQSKALLSFVYVDQKQYSKACNVWEELEQLRIEEFGENCISTRWAQLYLASSLLDRDDMRNESAMSILTGIYSQLKESKEPEECELALQSLSKQAEVFKHLGDKRQLRRVNDMIQGLRSRIVERKKSEAAVRPEWCSCDQADFQSAQQIIDEDVKDRSFRRVVKSFKGRFTNRHDIVSSHSAGPKIQEAPKFEPFSQVLHPRHLFIFPDILWDLEHR